MRQTISAAMTVAGLLALAACTGSPEETPSSESHAPIVFVVGAATPDQGPPLQSQIIAELYAGALNEAGVVASTRPNIGSREEYFEAVRDGSVDVVPDYTGSLLQHVDKDATEVSADEIVRALPAKLPDGLAVLEPAKAESRDAMVVTKANAEKYQLRSLDDMSGVCSELIFGAPATFAERANGLPGLRSNYHCEPKKLELMEDGGGSLTLKALLENRVQVANIHTTAPSIADHDLVILEDPKNNFIGQQVIPLYNEATMTDAAKEALNSVSATLTTEDLVSLNRAVSGSQKQDAKEAAAAWLKDKGIVK